MSMRPDVVSKNLDTMAQHSMRNTMLDVTSVDTIMLRRVFAD